MKRVHTSFLAVGVLSLFLLGGCFGSCGGGSSHDEEDMADVRQNDRRDNDRDSDRDNDRGQRRDRDRDNDSDETPDLSDLGSAIEDLGRALSGDSEVEPVDFRDLKNEILPKDVPNMKRISASGERTGMFGINVATAEGEFRPEDEDDPARVTITITDLGSIKGAAMLGYGWLMTEVDRESENGFERTRKYKDYPAHEEFTLHGDTGTGNLQFVVEERFVVEGKGRNIKDMEPVYDALDEVPIRELKKRAK